MLITINSRIYIYIKLQFNICHLQYNMYQRLDMRVRYIMKRNIIEDYKITFEKDKYNEMEGFDRVALCSTIKIFI